MAIKLTERYFIIYLVFAASAYSQRNQSELENDVSAMKKLPAVQNSKIARLEEIADRCMSKLSLQSLDGSVQLSKSWSDREKRQEEQRIPRFIVPSFSTVAFYAYKSRNFENVTIYQTMIYDMVVTNAGGAYDSNTGVFWPPESGIYGFSWTILVSGWKNVNGQYGEIAIEIMQWRKSWNCARRHRNSY